MIIRNSEIKLKYFTNWKVNYVYSRPTLALAVKRFVVKPLLLLIIICGLASAEKAPPTHSLTLQRILSEFNEICSQGISFDTPFNSTRDEVL